jgi:hypothetical protein
MAEEPLHDKIKSRGNNRMFNTKITGTRLGKSY